MVQRLRGSRSVLICCLSLLAGCPEDAGVEDEAGDMGTGEGGSESGFEIGSETSVGSETDETGGDTGGLACGDGVIEGEELCDDGNRVDGDGCESDCTPTTCGGPSWILRQPEVLASGNSVGGTPVVLLPDGVVVTAHEQNGDPGIDVALQAWDGQGELLWSTNHSFDTARDRPWRLAADPAGDLYLAAEINAQTASRASISKHSGTDGALMWAVERDGALPGAQDRAAAIDIDGQGRVVTVLELNDAEDQQDLVLLALSPEDGAEQWSATWSGEPALNGSSVDLAANLVVDPTGDRLYLLANRDLGLGDLEPTLLIFEPPAEQPVLEQVVGGVWGRGLTVGPEGEIILAALTEVRGDYGFTIEARAPEDGAPLWTLNSSALFADPGMYIGWDTLQLLPDGGLTLAGWSSVFPDHQHAWYMELEPGVGMRCLDAVDPLARWGSGVPLFLSLVVREDGAVFVSGAVTSTGYASMVARWR